MKGNRHPLLAEMKLMQFGHSIRFVMSSFQLQYSLSTVHIMYERMLKDFV